MHLKDLQSLTAIDVYKKAESLQIEGLANIKKDDQIISILKHVASNGDSIYAEGLLQVHLDGFGFLYPTGSNFVQSINDIYISKQQINMYGFVTGDTIECEIEPPRENERYFSVKKILKVNGEKPNNIKHRVRFENLTPLYPTEKINLDIDENSKGRNKDYTTRIMDIVSPIGKGQRSLIVAPPRTGKTIVLQNIANAISTNHPEAHLIVLLIDERPEEVTDMQRTVKGEVIASTFDEPATRHVHVSELVLEKAKRLVEQKQEVIILLDSITRLGRAYNTVTPSSGKVLSGGIDSKALQRPKRFFGAARNIEEGGSLTIIATSLIDTGSKMDEVIFEEFKGTGNSELVLDRKLSDKRLFPAIDINKSGTRKEELLTGKQRLAKSWIIRKIINPMSSIEAMEFLVEKVKATKNNDDFFNNMQ